MNAPKHVILSTYNPATKAMVSYDALVIGSVEREDHDYPVLTTVHFRHDDVASHHALTGVDYLDTLSRTFDVAHKDDKVNQSFYYVEGDEVELKRKCDWLRKELQKANDQIKAMMQKADPSQDRASLGDVAISPELAKAAEKAEPKAPKSAK
ncbi:MAG: hypothetical protein WBD45_04350 [Terriglobales bacterium]